MTTRPIEIEQPTTDAVVMAGRLRLSATRLARQLRQESDAGLSPSQLSALATIERHGPLTLGALAEHERVAPPSVTKVVAKLEAAGLVERQLDAADRRVARVSTTPGRRRAASPRSASAKTAWLAARLGRARRRRAAPAWPTPSTSSTRSPRIDRRR